MIKVLIVNEARLICSAMTVVMRGESDIRVLGSVTTVEEALLRVNDVDVLLVDANLPGQGALVLTQKATKTKAGIYVLITGVEKAADNILTYIEAGAAGYVLKEMTVDEMIQHIRAVVDEKALIDPEIIAKLISRVSELADICIDQERVLQELGELTSREREVLDLVSDGLSNQEIADTLVIEVGTVKNHVHSILDKLNVNSRHDAARIYQQLQEEEA